MSKRQKGFYDREYISPLEFSRRYQKLDPQFQQRNPFEDYVVSRRKRYEDRSDTAFTRAENFLLLVNSGALAGAITLAARGDGEIDLVFGSSIFLFFASIAFLGMSRWCMIVYSEYIRGEFYKNFIRFRAGKINEFDLVKRDYDAHGNPTFTGVFMALSFGTFILGWVLLVAPILRPDGLIADFACNQFQVSAENFLFDEALDAVDRGP